MARLCFGFMRALEGDVSVFFGWQLFSFGAKRSHGLAQPRSSLLRHDYFINVPKFGSLEWVGERLSIVFDEFVFLRHRILGLAKFFAEDDIHRAVGTHHGDF